MVSEPARSSLGFYIPWSEANYGVPAELGRALRRSRGPPPCEHAALTPGRPGTARPHSVLDALPAASMLRPDDLDGTITDDRLRSHITGAYHELLLRSENLDGFLHGFLALTLTTVSDTENSVMGALSLFRERRAPAAVFLPARARALDETQGCVADGPGTTALREQATVRAGDVQRDHRWPAYRAAAATLGVRAVLAVPFDLGEEAHAAISLHSSKAHDFGAEMIGAVEAYVHQASHVLRLAVRMARHRDIEDDLRAAMASRTTIDLAVGIIMGQNRCSQDEAVAILKAASNHRNQPLVDVAAEVVEGVSPQAPRLHFDS